MASGSSTPTSAGSHTEAELMGVKNFGATSLTEVHEKLGALGLGLRNIEDDGVVPAPAEG